MDAVLEDLGRMSVRGHAEMAKETGRWRGLVWEDNQATVPYKKKKYN